MAPDVNRGSAAAAERKFTYRRATDSSGREPAAPAWHIAQLMPTRGYPTVTFENPIGIS
jgi:hypothetical protein